MKIAKIPLSRTGLFVIVSFSLLVVALFVIGDKQKLFSSTSIYYIKFKEISGLKQGAQVTISGINVGSVGSIALPSKSGDSVLLSVNVIKEGLALIHSDSRASVVAEGLVGNKGVAISVGTLTAPNLLPGSFIVGESGRELMGIVDTVTATLAVVKLLTQEATGLIQDLRAGKGSMGKLFSEDGLYKDLRLMLVNTDRSIASISRIAVEMGKSIDNLLHNMSGTSTELKNLALSINTGKGTIGKLLNDSDLYSNLRSLSLTVNSAVIELRDAMTKISAASGNTVEITEALKHSFLVKGYFEDRGYWNAAEYEKSIGNRIDSLKRIETIIDNKLKLLRH